MGCLCVMLRVFRGFDFDTGEGGHRGRELKFGYRGAHGGRARHGVARRLRDGDGGRSMEHRQKELALPRALGACDGRVVALLFQSAANRRSFEGHPRRQIQRRPRHPHGLYIPPRGRHGEDAHRRRADSDRDVRADSVNLRQASDFAVVVSKMEITTCR